MTLRKVLAIADLHILSNYGLAPKVFEGEEGSILKPNEGQERLLKYWKHLCGIVDTEKWKPQEIWIVGDIFAGLNPIELGRRKRGSLDEQFHAAEFLIKKLPEDIPIKIWSGSSYHASKAVQMHEKVAESLDHNRDASFKGSWSYEEIGKSKRAFVTHEASSAVVYPATPMVRDSRWFKQQFADGKMPRINLIVRAHKHAMHYIDDRSIKILQLPCWQLLVPYKGSMRMFPMYQPDLGGVFIHLDGNDRISIQEWLYPPFQMTEKGKVIEVPYSKSEYVTGWS